MLSLSLKYVNVCGTKSLLQFFSLMSILHVIGLCFYIVSNEKADIKKENTKEKKQKMLYWSGREDSNLWPPGPKPGALTRLRHVPTRCNFDIHLASWQSVVL